MGRVIVPRFWAEARMQERRGGKQVTVRRWGWSDEGPSQAQTHANARAREVLDRILAGEPLERRERKVPYNGAEGIPIREQVVSRHGEAVVTRNSYGALCLNTPDVLFADVDFDTYRLPCAGLLGAAVAAGALVGVLSRRVVAGLMAGVGALVLAALAWRLLQAVLTTAAGGQEALALSRIRRFADAHPGWRIRVYRTPAGLRALVLHRRFDPASDEVASFFRALKTDPIYVRMCLRQGCFRARVSPKPWRIGIDDHLKPRPGVWPVRPERTADRDRWIAAYDAAAKGYAACRFVEDVGAGSKDPDADAVRALHDDLSRAGSDLPLA